VRARPKEADPDLQLLDNTTALIQLLEAGGRMAQVLTATDPADEDPFLLGPDLLDQLKLKGQIMRRHRLDAEEFLFPPHK